MSVAPDTLIRLESSELFKTPDEVFKLCKPTRLAAALRLLLAANNMDQKDLATAIGVSQSAITRFLKGECILEATTMLRLMTWMLDTK